MEQRITVLHTLLTQYGVEDKDIPLYLRALRMHNMRHPLTGMVKLPKGKISFQDFDEQENMLTQGSEKLVKEISEEKQKIDLYEAKLKEPIWSVPEKQRFTQGKAHSESIISTHFHTLAGYDMKLYELYNLEPIDHKKFYADISPLLNELNALLTAQAHARRNGTS
jgi:hypothetical protein